MGLQPLPPWGRATAGLSAPVVLGSMIIMSTWPFDQMRSRMARSVLDRVAGDVEWVDTSGVPWLPVDSPVRRAHANAAMLVGGVRAVGEGRVLRAAVR